MQTKNKREGGIEAKDVKRLLLKIYKRLHAKEIDGQQAYKEAYILNSVLKAIEITDLEDRLKKIENSIT